MNVSFGLRFIFQFLTWQSYLVHKYLGQTESKQNVVSFSRHLAASSVHLFSTNVSAIYQAAQDRNGETLLFFTYHHPFKLFCPFCFLIYIFFHIVPFLLIPMTNGRVCLSISTYVPSKPFFMLPLE